MKKVIVRYTDVVEKEIEVEDKLIEQFDNGDLFDFELISKIGEDKFPLKGNPCCRWIGIITEIETENYRRSEIENELRVCGDW